MVYCRGTCKGNGAENAVAGIGIWWVPGDSRQVLCGLAFSRTLSAFVYKKYERTLSWRSDQQPSGNAGKHWALRLYFSWIVAQCWPVNHQGPGDGPKPWNAFVDQDRLQLCLFWCVQTTKQSQLSMNIT